MSAYTTLRVTRDKALSIRLKKLIDNISDEELEDYMDDLMEPRLYNVIIVPSDSEDNDDDMV